ncbi:divalent metal cation transporter [Vibrio sp. OCN044]|uniref:Divalent metal cation transporter n=1 Tax=Vibrio tetraodonis subsp. pristinus TaxID=2695891 RepID=A0A6L8LZ36_9VIBR|nr:divalent metal cation transporter [Vibrio tetraodonis]MYM61394.1 divalent metal cation transporter [Vibrio tetraodonis subsp. pristinus]
MDTISSSDSQSKLSLLQLARSTGPGIIMTTGAVGSSHLVASTQAGATYGWQIAIVILLVNILKYPFFRASIQYTAGTGESLVEGYAKLGQAFLWLFWGITIICGISSISALILFSSNLLSHFLPFELSLNSLAMVIVAVCLLALFSRRYHVLNNISKVIMLILIVTLITALALAATQTLGSPVPIQEKTPWSSAAIGFIIATMVWMPAPIEVSSMTSIWLKDQQKGDKVSAQTALLDFNAQYIVTMLLALAFLALGVLVFSGSGLEFSQSGIEFSNQLIDGYTSKVGQSTYYLIAAVAFCCIFGSAITAMDGYSRAIAEAQRLLQEREEISHKASVVWMMLIAFAALALILFWFSSVLSVLYFSLALAFITTPFFALLNFILVSHTKLPKPLALTKPMKWLSILGLIYLFGFLAVFFWWNWLV